MPEHWNILSVDSLPRPLNIIAVWTIQFLIFVAYGYFSMETAWEFTNSPRDIWLEYWARFYGKLSTAVVVSSLLLATTAAFLSTAPPRDALFDYGTRYVYLCLFGSLACALAAAIVGCVVLAVVMTDIVPEAAKRTYMRSRATIILTIYLLAYPFLAMAAATQFLVVALLMAALTSKDRIVVCGAVVFSVVPAMCLPAWWWVQRGYAEATIAYPIATRGRGDVRAHKCVLGCPQLTSAGHGRTLDHDPKVSAADVLCVGM